MPLPSIATAAALILAAAALVAPASAYFDNGIHAPFQDPKLIDVALKKFFDDCGGKNWPSPWGDRWGKDSSCAWDGNERGKPAPFGTRCLNGGWHKLPPESDGGLLFMEHYSRMAECEMPAEFSACQMVQNVGLWNNKLKGKLWNTSMHEFLNRLDVSYNALDAPLPDDFMQRNIRESELINLAHNKIPGSIPKSIGTLTILQALRLDSNALTGAIPEEITKLPQLRHLALGNNKLSGAVPSLKGLAALGRLDLSRNELEGVPPELPDTVTRVDLSFNKWAGKIPESYGKLPLLRHFNCTGCDKLECPSPDLLAHLPFSTHCNANSRKW